MARLAPDEVDPVTSVAFRIALNDRVATAGSCFAQHIARTLSKKGFQYLVTEDGPPEDGYGLFPARFGNVYTPRQLLQLFDRAYGLFTPSDEAWTMPSGAVADPFRPSVEKNGFASIGDLKADRRKHFSAVRSMFENCDVFIFTLGLTEGWQSSVDGAVFPLAPGVAAEPPDAALYEFHNFSVTEMLADMRSFLAKLRAVNPRVEVILTVSPVALMATYENRHVLVSTIYSKSALRVVADELTRSEPSTEYFPSYEIITGPHNRYRFLAEDLREVLPAGVDHVMEIFSRHYLTAEPSAVRTEASTPTAREVDEPAVRDTLYDVVCDEEALDV